MYLALARQDARPLAKALKARPEIHPDCQWATFVRNHDELTLDKLSRRGAAGGLRRLRARARDADLRPRSQAPAAADAGRRPPAPADGLQPALHACRARRRSTTARRSAWARTSRPRAGWRCAPRCSGSPDATAASRPRRPRGWCSALVPGRLRPGARQRRRPAARPRLAVDLHACARSRPTGSAPSSAGASSACSDSRTGRSWPPLPLGGPTVVAVHNLSGEPVTATYHTSTRATRSGRRRCGSRTCCGHEALQTGPGAASSSRWTAMGHRWLRVRRDDRPRR